MAWVGPQPRLFGLDDAAAAEASLAKAKTLEGRVERTRAPPDELLRQLDVDGEALTRRARGLPQAIDDALAIDDGDPSCALVGGNARVRSPVLRASSPSRATPRPRPASSAPNRRG